VLISSLLETEEVMKYLFAIPFILGATLLAEENDLVAGDEPRITSRLPGEPPLEAPKPAPDPVTPYLHVEDTMVRQLPDRKITFHRVTDPNLPPLPKPKATEPLDFDNPVVKAWMDEKRAAWIESRRFERLVFLSATVYDGKKSHLRVWMSGGGKTVEMCTAWSNIDFNHFSGLGSFEVGKMSYHLFMGIGNAPTAEHQRRYGLADWPKPPEIPADGPGYSISGSGEGTREAEEMIATMHRLYANEKERLVTAAAAREEMRKARAAELEANPPQPEDLEIHFWRGKRDDSEGAEKGATR